MLNVTYSQIVGCAVPFLFWITQNVLLDSSENSVSTASLQFLIFHAIKMGCIFQYSPGKRVECYLSFLFYLTSVVDFCLNRSEKLDASDILFTICVTVCNFIYLFFV